MDTEKIYLDRAEAETLYRKYKEHANYSSPIDWECQRAYQLLAKGKLVIKALESVVAAGLNEASLPKLALAGATAKACFLKRRINGSATMRSTDNWRTKSNSLHFANASFRFPADSFPWGWDRKSRVCWSNHKAQLPLIPVHLRPKRGLANYHVLWEAEWQPIPPRDPYLLRRIGKADLWLVVAHWDLTEVERAVLATRVAT
jgi:hypothetical protein